MTTKVLMTLKEAAEELLVSETTIRRLVAAREFPHSARVGRQIRIPRSDLEAYLERQRKFPTGDDSTRQ
jgi:excisionase family DNA binding protein